MRRRDGMDAIPGALPGFDIPAHQAVDIPLEIRVIAQYETPLSLCFFVTLLPFG